MSRFNEKEDESGLYWGEVIMFSFAEEWILDWGFV